MKAETCFYCACSYLHVIPMRCTVSLSLVAMNKYFM